MPRTGVSSPATLWKDKVKGLGCPAIPLGCAGTPFIFMLAALALGTIVVGPWYLVTLADQNLLSGILLIALAVIVHFASDWFYGKQISEEMNKVIPTEDPISESGETEPGVSMESQYDNQPKACEINIITYDESAAELADTEQEQYLRHRLLNRSGSVFFNFILAALIAGAVTQTLILLVNINTAPPEKLQSEWAQSGGFFFIMKLTTKIILPFSLALTVLFIARKIRLTTGILTGFLVGIIAHALPVLLFVALLTQNGQPKDKDDPFNLLFFMLPAILYVLVVLAGWVYTRKGLSSRSQPSFNQIKLLVLRVFGISRNTRLLFGHVFRYWPLVGPVVTIADPTYAQFVFSKLRYQLLLLLALPSLLFIALTQDFQATGWMGINIVSCYYVCWIPLILGYRIWQLKNTSGRNMKAIKQRLAHETGSFLRSNHASIKLMCYGNLWKPAMAHLVTWTDIILMDLRGFQKERLGCRYELAYLLNHWPMSKMVFLTDPTTDSLLLESTLKELANELDSRSPNAGLDVLSIHLYHAHNHPDRFKNEIRSMLALMGELAVSGNRDTVKQNKESVADSALPAFVKNTQKMQTGAWMLWLTGLLLQMIFNADGMKIYSGMSVMWLGTIAVMITWRIKVLMLRDGQLNKANFFGYPLFNWFLWILAIGWLGLYVWIPLQN